MDEENLPTQKKVPRWVLICAPIVGLFVLIGVLAWASFDSRMNVERLSAFFTGLLALATLIAATAIGVGIAQVREARKALKDNRAWNRMNAAMTYMPVPDIIRHDWEEKLEGTFLRFISRNDPLSPEEVTRLNHADEAETRFLLRAYLNILECYCAAVNAGLAEAEIARRLWGYKILRHFNELKPYIEHARHTTNNSDLYNEIEALCKVWTKEVPITPIY